MLLKVVDSGNIYIIIMKICVKYTHRHYMIWYDMIWYDMYVCMYVCMYAYNLWDQVLALALKGLICIPHASHPGSIPRCNAGRIGGPLSPSSQGDELRLPSHGAWSESSSNSRSIVGPITSHSSWGRHGIFDGDPQVGSDMTMVPPSP